MAGSVTTVVASNWKSAAPVIVMVVATVVLWQQVAENNCDNSGPRLKEATPQKHKGQNISQHKVENETIYIHIYIYMYVYIYRQCIN